MRKLVFIVQSWEMLWVKWNFEKCHAAAQGRNVGKELFWFISTHSCHVLIFMLVSCGTPLEARGSYGPEKQHAKINAAPHPFTHPDTNLITYGLLETAEDCRSPEEGDLATTDGC